MPLFGFGNCVNVHPLEYIYCPSLLGLVESLRPHWSKKTSSLNKRTGSDLYFARFVQERNSSKIKSFKVISHMSPAWIQ